MVLLSRIQVTAGGTGVHPPSSPRVHCENDSQRMIEVTVMGMSTAIHDLIWVFIAGIRQAHVRTYD